jgi:hypothetical protein
LERISLNSNFLNLELIRRLLMWKSLRVSMTWSVYLVGLVLVTQVELVEQDDLLLPVFLDHIIDLRVERRKWNPSVPYF